MTSKANFLCYFQVGVRGVPRAAHGARHRRALQRHPHHAHQPRVDRRLLLGRQPGNAQTVILFMLQTENTLEKFIGSTDFLYLCTHTIP